MSAPRHDWLGESGSRPSSLAMADSFAMPHPHRRVCGLWSVSTRRFCRVTTASLIAQPPPSRQGRAGTTPELLDIAATAMAWWERRVQAAGLSPMVGEDLVDLPTADLGVSAH